MSIAAEIYDNATGVLGFLVAIVVGLRAALWLRGRTHRPSAATGDAELARMLDELSSHRTRRVAVIVAEQGLAPRTAFIDSSADEYFELGSLSKVMTGLVVADSIDRGELSVDTALGELDVDLPTSLSDITIEQLITHTSGLPRLPGSLSMTLRALAHGLFLIDPYAGITPQRVVDDAARSRRTSSREPLYSNLGAALVGQVLAAAQQVSYSGLIDQRLLTPLGMTGSAATPARRTVARGWHGSRRAARWHLDGYAPAGGVVSTPADMTRLAQAIVDGTAPGLATSLQTVHQGRGMFWVLRPGGGAWHNGETGGYSSYLTLNVTGTRRVIVVLADTVPAEEQQRFAENIAQRI